MQAVAILILVLSIGSAFSLGPVYYKVQEVNETLMWGETPGPRIYSGDKAAERQFPFMIFALMMLENRNISLCSASLIYPEWVLLSAHCVCLQGMKEIILVGGKANLLEYVNETVNTNKEEQRSKTKEIKFGVQERRGKRIFIHPDYKDYEHDIALVELNRAFDLGPVQTIPLALEEMKTAKTCTILGWGLTINRQKSFHLNYAEGSKAKTTRLGCNKKKWGPYICLEASDQGICQGDSGSPLVCDGQVYGVASHFYADNKKVDCGNSSEDIYAELYPDLDWIKKTINSSICQGDSGSPLVCNGQVCGQKKTINSSPESAVANARGLLFCAVVSLWLAVKE